MKRSVLYLAVLTLSVSTASEAKAVVITFADRSAFNSEGTIAYDSNFNDFGSYFSFPGDPFTRGGVTYTSTQNLITGPTTSYHPVENLMTNNYWSPVGVPHEKWTPS